MRLSGQDNKQTQSDLTKSSLLKQFDVVFPQEEEENEISETQTAIQNDMDLKEMTAFTPEQASARAVDDQEQLCEVISDALFVLTSVLVSIKLHEIALKHND